MSNQAEIAHPLYEGTFSVGLNKKFNRINRSDPPEKGALKLSLNPFLIQANERNYLFDAGLGDFGEDTSTATIKENLEALELSEYDISDIFLSHLHYDHIGGLAGKSSGFWELTFPDANVWVSEQAWKKVTGQDEYYDEEKTEFIHFLNAKANLQFLNDENQPYPDITIKTIGGHTEFSKVLLFDNGTHKYLMAGDVLGTRGAVNRKFAAKYDYDGKKSMEMRELLLQKAYEEQFVLMGYHETHHPLFRLSDYEDKKGYIIDNL